jgi:Cu/Ag efflux protein CusF
MRNHLVGAFGVALLAISACSRQPEPPKSVEVAPAPQVESTPAEPTHSVSGVVESVDPANGTITIKSDDGAVQTVKLTKSTKVGGLEGDVKAIGDGTAELGKDIWKDTKKGAHVVVHYTEDGAEKTAKVVKHGWDSSVKTTKAVVRKIDKEARTVTVKTKDGAEHVYEVTKDATITVAKKIAKAGEAAGTAIKEGSEATFHFVEQGGKKVAHSVEGND